MIFLTYFEISTCLTMIYTFSSATICLINQKMSCNLNSSIINIAVRNGRKIELLTTKGQVVASLGHSLFHSSAIAYDSVHTDIYVSDTSQNNVSIFRIHVTKNGKSGPLQPVVYNNTKYIQGLSYDPVTSTLFWTTGIEKTIMKAYLNENKTELAEGIALHSFNYELPYGITVDSCKGMVYWTNCNVSKPSIERSHIDGTGKEIIVSTKLFRPMSIIVSQADRLIYWIDEKAGRLFTIERCALDGSRREIVVYSENQQPLSLAVTAKSLYWTDDMNAAIQTTMHTNPELSLPITETSVVKSYTDRTTPGGIITAHQDSLLDENVCRNMIDLFSKVSSIVNVTDGTCLHGLATQTGSCRCARGYTGIYCETSLCHNFCLNNGECFLDDSGESICKCSSPFSGLRCEIDLCLDKCLNGGECRVLANGKTSECHCKEGYSGDRCEITTNICDIAFRKCGCSFYGIDSNIQESNNTSPVVAESRTSIIVSWPIWSLTTICILLFIICLILSVIIFRLKGRPRLIRRYQVNANAVKSSARAHSVGGDCEIAIENCCNMNICETPCYEPQFRTPGKNERSKKEEKCGLLPNIEIQPSDSAPPTNDLF